MILTRYQALGFSLLPVLASKAPMRPYTARGPYLTSEDAERRDGSSFRLPVALVLHDYVVLDIDTRNDGYASLAELPKLPRTWRSTTRSGGQHFYFRAPPADRPAKPWRGIDLLTGFRYCLEAPTPGYSWLVAPWDAPIADLPDWVPVRAPEPTAPAQDADLPYDVRVSRAESYADAYPPAISGQGGHNTTFVLAARLVHQFKLSDADALRILTRYSNTCVPPWSDKDLRHKISSARRHSNMRQGVRQ